MKATDLSIAWKLLAGKWMPHVQALALGEHDGHKLELQCLVGHCRFGDNDHGCAFGVLQQHPDFLEQFWVPAEHQNWAEAQVSAAAHYFDHYAGNDLGLVIQAYNQGAHAVFVKGVRNLPYFLRWQRYFTVVTAPGWAWDLALAS